MAYLMNCVTSKLKCALLLVIKCYVKLVENTVQTFYIFINFYLFLVQFLKEECEDYFTILVDCAIYLYQFCFMYLETLVESIHILACFVLIMKQLYCW